MKRRMQRGAAAVEMAILLIPLVIMAFGMTEIGRAAYYYNTLVVATRDAARYLSTRPTGEGEPYARCLAVHGNPQCNGDPLVPGLTTDMVRITYSPAVDTGNGPIDLVGVGIEGFPFQSAVPYVIPHLRFATIACTMRQTS